MSIKKLFDSVDKNLQFQDYKTQKEAFEPVESARNAQAIELKQKTFVPQIDYSDPENFAFYGSAQMYYSGAFNRILDFYPYDGSKAEKNEFYNKLYPIEQYVFDVKYPKSTGYAIMSSDGWGDIKFGIAMSNGYGTPAVQEYITFLGGPGTGSTGSTLASKMPNQYSSRSDFANVYNTDIYTSEGLPSDYGKGTRASNLQANFDTGVTVEFWLKKPAFDTVKTVKEVIFDLWNSGSTGANTYGRLTIEVDGEAGASPFRITAQSGSTPTGIFEQTIGTTPTLSSIKTWNHYAMVFQNSGSSFVTKLYVNGYWDDTNITTSTTIGDITLNSMLGRVGSLLAPPNTLSASAGSGKLSASIDEFRFWKTARDSKQIVEHWFTDIGGGTNTDISNTTLGVYYKFNEGITALAATDSVVLDYAGRITNGAWTGYNSTSRNTGSAMVSASATTWEPQDPIMRSNNTRVSTLKTELINKGINYDSTNNAAFINYAPSWVIEQHENEGNKNLKIISHVMGAYFDQMHLLTQQMPGLRHFNYTTASVKPLPFASHLPQSLGLYTPEIFVDASILEKFESRTEKELFESKLNEARNLIYLNLYNNLTNIYKAKGTSKAIRNVLRCFNLDDSLLKTNVYVKDTTYQLKNNLTQYMMDHTSLNFNQSGNIGSVIYQASDPTNAYSKGYISGTMGSFGSALSGAEDRYGCTAEADVTFPIFFSTQDKLVRNFTTVSLFGCHAVNTGSVQSLSGTNTTYTTGAWGSTYDLANFQVLAVRDAPFSKNVYFKLTSSVYPHSLPVLTSSVFYGAYDDSQWNLSVRVKPSTALAEIVSGAFGSYSYDVIFRGVNNTLGTVRDSFEVSASVNFQTGSYFLRQPKRLYVGAQRTNITGALINKSDVRFENLKFWSKFVDNTSLNQHLFDTENAGISGSYKNISIRDPHTDRYDVVNANMLALNWNFEQVTSSNGTGNFVVQDFSSGSALLSDVSKYGWLANVVGYQHTGYGSNFPNSDQNVVQKQLLNLYKFSDPERATAADMINILSKDDEVYGINQTPPDFVYTVEKSQYDAVSEEMLKFFAGVIDFNNVIGAPVNRYRDHYKDLEFLREAFFRRVTTMTEVERYLGYYKWFDDAISEILRQLVPASANLIDGVLNTIEPTVLERPKYESKFPTLQREDADPEAVMTGEAFMNYPARLGSRPAPQTTGSITNYPIGSINNFYWKNRAQRTDPVVSTIRFGASTAAAAIMDAQREKIRKVVISQPYLSRSAPTFFNESNSTLYTSQDYRILALGKLQKIEAAPLHKLFTAIKGGTNWTSPKSDIQLAYTALQPAGPINHAGGRYIPQNILLGFLKDLVPLPYNNDPKLPTEKVKRYMKVHHGRNANPGVATTTGNEYYDSMKSSFVFPFNIISSSVKTGYMSSSTCGSLLSHSIEITNLHHDVYGPDSEVPMQGPFTNYAVGGHQSRHIQINNMAGHRAPTGSILGLSTLPSNGDTIQISDGDTTIMFTFKHTAVTSVDVEIDGDTTDTLRNLAVVINNQAFYIYAKSYVSKPLVELTNTNPRIDGKYDKGNVTLLSGGSTAWIGKLVGMTGGRGFGLAGRKTRPEAWKIFLGTCDITLSGAIGMTGPDYPHPTDYDSVNPYPNTSSQRAIYYRDMTAKRPVNIKNIRLTTGSTILGNYTKNYEVVQAPGGFSNPKNWAIASRDGKLPTLPSNAFQNRATGTLVIETYLDMPYLMRSGAMPTWPYNLNSPSSSHFSFVSDYSTSYLTASTGNSIIISRFSNNGGPEVESRGHQDFKSTEYSVYNTLNFRNLSVRKHSQGSKGMYSETNGIRISDIHGNDYGLQSHLARHTARFGRDSLAFPHTDAERDTYDLTRPFTGFSEEKQLRGHTQNLQGWWRLNKDISSAGNAIDSSGRGRDGTFDAAADRPTYSTLIYPSTYIQTSSLDFDVSSNDKINIGTAAVWDALIGNDTANGSTEQMTFCAWIYKNGDGGGNLGRIIDFGDGDVVVTTNVSEQVGFIAKWNGAQVLWSTTLSNLFKLDQWAHIAITYDATNTANDPKIYINGIEYVTYIVSGTKTGTYDGVGTEDCYIGGDFSDAYSFEGNISDVGAWNKVLPSDEIRAIFNASLTPGKRGPGASNVKPDRKYDYTQPPGFHKVHRNNLLRPKQTSETYTQLYVGSELVNVSECGYGDINVNTSFLANTWWDEGSSTVPSLITAFAGGAGFTFTGWVKFASINSNMKEDIFNIGLRAGDTPLVRLAKWHDGYSSLDYILLSVSVWNNNGGSPVYAINEWKFAAPTMRGTWKHIALSWILADGKLDNIAAETAPTVYIDGVALTLTTFTQSPGKTHYKPNTSFTKATFKGHTLAPGALVGNAFLNLGSGINSNQDPISASVDEYTLWRDNLSSANITEIYNSGVPCDITASTAYSTYTSAFYDWIRFEDGGTNELTIDAANPGKFQAGNRMVSFNNKEYMPIATFGSINNTVERAASLTGCVQVKAGFLTTKTIASVNTYDNFNITHQIPRTSRQYMWISDSIINDNSNQFTGFAPASFKIPNLVSGVKQGTKNAYTFVSQSDFGAYYHAGSTNKTKYGWTSASIMAGATVGRFLPVDFAGLNTIVISNVNTSTNTIGATGSNPRIGAPVWAPNYKGVGPYLNPYVIEAIANTESTASLLNAINLNRGGAYGYPMWKQSPGRSYMNPIIRAERKTNKISMVSNDPASTTVIGTEFQVIGGGRDGAGRTINVYDGIARYDLPPVSMMGRPGTVNFTAISRDGTGTEDTTLVATNNNESIYFTTPNMNNEFDIDYDSYETPFEVLIKALPRPAINEAGLETQTNWILYEQKLFPSARNEFASASRGRLNYDNRFWSDNRFTRNLKSAVGRNVLTRSNDTAFTVDYFGNNYSASVNTFNQWVRQSSWPLDAPDNFMTRSTVPYLPLTSDIPTPPGGTGLYTWYRGTVGSTGELQNTYTNFFSGSNFMGRDIFDNDAPSITNFYRIIMSTAAPMYARKHLVSNPRSFVSPTGIKLAQTGATWYTPVLLSDSIAAGRMPVSGGAVWSNKQWLTNSWGSTHQILPIGAGEALWEPGPTAGVIRNVNGGLETPYGTIEKQFQLSASAPWFDNYTDFNYVLDLIAKDYAIMPEYRMSENVKNYADSGQFPDTLELSIPGAYENTNEPDYPIASNANTADFFLDYSNAEFLGADVQKIFSATGLLPTEIVLTASAAIRFNPYKGLYPAQRTLDLVKQFRTSYAKAIYGSYGFAATQVPNFMSAPTEWKEFEGGTYRYNMFFPSTIGTGMFQSPLLARPMFQALFAPGLLYNSIKSGMAVDYPIVTSDSIMQRSWFGTSSQDDVSRVARWSMTSSNDTWNQNYALAYSEDINPVYNGVGAPSASTAHRPDFFGKRIPFEAMITPATILDGTTFYDLESNPSASLMNVTASFKSDSEDIVYTKMAQNFFGQVADFFLEDSNFTAIKSRPAVGIQQFTPGEVYMARVKMRRSTEGNRNYISESILSNISREYAGVNAQMSFEFISNTKTDYAAGAGLQYLSYMNGRSEDDPNNPYHLWFSTSAGDYGPILAGTETYGTDVVIDISDGGITTAGGYATILKNVLLSQPYTDGASRSVDTTTVTASIQSTGTPTPTETGTNLAAAITTTQAVAGATQINPYSRAGGRPYNSYSTTGAPASPLWSFHSGANWDYRSGSEEGFPLPQDPIFSNVHETFTMYSRPTAFGPEIAGRVPGTSVTASARLNYFPLDTFNGFNWAYTPPYYNGEAWADLIFRPSGSVDYNLEKIMSETKTVYWRHDAGQVSSSMRSVWSANFARMDTRLVSSEYQYSITSSKYTNGEMALGRARSPYGGNNINRNAMQISASVNLFGIESVPFIESSVFPVQTNIRNTVAAKRWVIKPKFETPMMNFNDKGTRALVNKTSTAAAPLATTGSYLSVPTSMSASVPHGMWHQFGVLPDDPQTGVFLEIEDIPESWSKQHYLMLNTGSVYNNYNPLLTAAGTIHSMDVRSLSDLVGFGKTAEEPASKRLGQLAQSKTIKEGIVAIPYRLAEGIEDSTNSEFFAGKAFIGIPTDMYTAAIDDSINEKGNSLETAGASIRNLVQSMDEFILPPQLDFVNNSDIDPFVMYIFDFSYTLDRDDLSYLWQNLAPRNYKKAKIESTSIGHYIMDQELINTAILANTDSGNDEELAPLRWMLFKVKQRAKKLYSDLVPTQIKVDISEASSDGSAVPSQQMTLLPRARRVDSYRRSMTISIAPGNEAVASPPAFSERYQYNWPYDYLSFVEMVKMDANIMFTHTLPPGYDPVDAVADASELNPGVSQTMDTPAVFGNISAVTIPAGVQLATNPFTKNVGPFASVESIKAVNAGPGADFDPFGGGNR